VNPFYASQAAELRTIAAMANEPLKKRVLDLADPYEDLTQSAVAMGSAKTRRISTMSEEWIGLATPPCV
jgi:hypothetical protein